MKLKTDYITNSSSSSFIMAFKNNDRFASYENFKDKCEYLDYEAFYNLIDKIKNSKDGTNKESALEFLYHCYSWEYRLKLIKSKLKESNFEYYRDYIIAESEFENSEEFKAKMRKYMDSNDEYLKKKKQIEEADLVIVGEIWDTDGGLVEWAIRNGFIENNFINNHVITWNVG